MNKVLVKKFQLSVIGLMLWGLVGCGGGGASTTEGGAVTGVAIPSKVSVVNAN